MSEFVSYTDEVMQLRLDEPDEEAEFKSVRDITMFDPNGWYPFLNPEELRNWLTRRGYKQDVLDEAVSNLQRRQDRLRRRLISATDVIINVGPPSRFSRRDIGPRTVSALVYLPEHEIDYRIYRSDLASLLAASTPSEEQLIRVAHSFISGDTLGKDGTLQELANTFNTRVVGERGHESGLRSIYYPKPRQKLA